MKAECGVLGSGVVRSGQGSADLNLGGLGDLDLGQLQGYIPNVNFPASKDEVLSDAQSNNAPQEVVDGIRNSGKDTFNSAEEVLQAVQGRL